MARILIVDDESVPRVLLGKHLVDAGYTVNFAGNGWEALISMRRDKFDLIFCDVKMPGLGGVIFIEMMMAEHKTDAPPVIVLADPTDDLGQLVGLEVQAIILKGQDRLGESLSAAHAVLRPAGSGGSSPS